MPLRDWLDEVLTLVAPGDGAVPDGQGGSTRSSASGASQLQVKGKIEARGGQGRRLVTDAGDVVVSTHLATLMPAVQGPDGVPVRDLVRLFGPAGSAATDYHVRGPDQGDYIVVAPARIAKVRGGRVHHIELELQVVGGGL